MTPLSNGGPNADLGVYRGSSDNESMSVPTGRINCERQASHPHSPTHSLTHSAEARGTEVKDRPTEGNDKKEWVQPCPRCVPSFKQNPRTKSKKDGGGRWELHDVYNSGFLSSSYPPVYTTAYTTDRQDPARHVYPGPRLVYLYSHRDSSTTFHSVPVLTWVGVLRMVRSGTTNLDLAKERQENQVPGGSIVNRMVPDVMRCQSLSRFGQ